MLRRSVALRLAMLAAAVLMLLPAFLTMAAEDKPQATDDACVRNLKNLYKALQQYGADHNGVLPPSNACFVAVSEYLNRSEEDAFGSQYGKCPAALTEKGSASYALNYWFVFTTPDYHGGSRKLADVPATTFLCADGRGIIYNPGYDQWKLDTDTDADGVPDSNAALWENGKLQYNGFSPRHHGGGYVLFADGSIKWISLRDFVSNKNQLWGDGTRP